MSLRKPSERGRVESKDASQTAGLGVAAKSQPREIKLLSYDDEEVKPKSQKAELVARALPTRPLHDKIDEPFASSGEESESSSALDDEEKGSSSSSEEDEEEKHGAAEDPDESGKDEDKNEKVAAEDSKTVEKYKKKSAEERLLKRLRNGVHRQAKLAKKFEIRRLIRMLEKARRSKTASNRVPKIEGRLTALKALDSDEVEQLAIALGQIPEEEEQPSVEDAELLEEDYQTNENDSDSDAPSKIEEKSHDAEIPCEPPPVVSRFTPEEAKSRFDQDPSLKNVLSFRGLQLAVREFLDRPKREERRRQREKQRRIQEALAEQKRLERLKNPLMCMIKMCTARFATEEAREKHRIKRHNTTGDWEKDISLGLRNSRPSSRERKALQLLKKGGPIEEIDRLMRPMTFAERRARKRDDSDDEDDSDEDNNKASKPGKSLGRKALAGSKPDEPKPRQHERLNGDRFGNRTSEPKRPRLETEPSRQKTTPSSARPENPSKRRKGEAAPAEAPKLHPSWEAKKKLQQTQVAEFQGTKVEFSDDD